MNNENENTQEYDGPMGQYRVTGVIAITDEEGVETGSFLEEGSVQNVPRELGDSWVNKGLAEDVSDAVVVADEEEEETADEQEETTPVADEAKKLYQGHEVISETIRTVNDGEYHHLRLADGSTYDLTDVEYEAYLKENE